MNLYRGLCGEEEISITLVDTTEVVNEGIRLHGLSPAGGYLLGKALTALAFFGACLKGEKGEVSLSFQRGQKEVIGGSVNKALHIRGYLVDSAYQGECGEEGERAFFGDGGAFTLVREDGYSRPFVGSCAVSSSGSMDEILEEYFRISEQLPTRIKTVLKMNEGGGCAFAGLIALQPLPFASAKSKQWVEKADLVALLSKMEREGGPSLAKALIEGEIEEGLARYRCHCSRERLSAVLVTLGKEQLKEIVLAEGAVRAHCHYCNTDYEFTGEDIEGLFSKEYEREKDEEN